MIGRDPAEIRFDRWMTVDYDMDEEDAAFCRRNRISPDHLEWIIGATVVGMLCAIRCVCGRPTGEEGTGIQQLQDSTWRDPHGRSVAQAGNSTCHFWAR